jgi:hypothetical protein
MRNYYFTLLQTDYSKLIARFIFGLLLLGLNHHIAEAQSTSAAIGNWNATATWTGATVPPTTNTVITNHNVTVTVVNATCAGLDIQTNTLIVTTGRTLTINGDLNVSGALSIEGTGIVTVIGNVTGAGTITFVANGTLNIAGNNTFSGTFTAGTGTVNYNQGSNGQNVPALNYNNLTFNAFNKVLANSGTIGIAGTFTPGAAAGHTTTNSTINFNGTGAQNIPTISTANYHHLIVSNGNTKTVTSAVVTNGNLTISTGTTLNPAGISLTVTGTTTIDGTLNDNNTAGTNLFIGKVTINTGGTFTNTNNPPFTFRGGIENNGTFNKTGTGITTFETNTQNITANAAMSIAGAVSCNVNSILDGASTIGFSGAVTIANNITLTNDNTNASTGVAIVGLLNGSANSIFLNRGILTYRNATQPMGTGTLNATTNPNTVNYNLGGAQGVKATTYHHLQITGGTGTKTLPAAVTVNGDFNIGSGASFNPAGFDFTVSGNSTIAGTFADATAAGTSSLQNVDLSGGTINGGANGIVNINGNLSMATGNGTIGQVALTVSGTTTVNDNRTLTISSASGSKIFVNTVTINSGATWTNSINEDIEFRNGLAHNGSTFTAGTGTYAFTTNNQSISGTSALSLGTVTVGTAPLAITLINSNSNASGLTVTTSMTGLAAFSIFENQSMFIYQGTSSLMATGILDADFNGNTVDYAATSGNQIIYHTDYWNLRTSGGGTKTWNSSNSGTLRTINNNLEITAGTLNLANTNNATNSQMTVNGNLTLSGSGILNLSQTTNNSGYSTVNLNGNFSQVSGTSITSTGTGTLASSSSIIFNGTSAQTITGGGSTTGGVFEINNSNGVSLTNNANVFTLRLTNGLVNTGSNTLTVNNSATTGIVAGSAFSGTNSVNGNLARVVTTTGTYSFPVSAGGTYSPLDIVNPGTATTITAQVFNSNPAGGAAGPGMNTLLNNNLYWRVNSAAAITTAIRLNVSGLASTDIIGRRTGSATGFYTNIGGTVTASDITSASVSLTAATDNFLLIGTGGTLSGTYSVGTGCQYANLTEVASTLNNAANVVTGNVFFEFCSGYDGTSGETFPISFNPFTTSGGSHTVTVRPAVGVTARVTSGTSASSGLIVFNGVDRLTFDGRPGGAGSSLEWTISCTSTTIGTLTFINDATNNVVQYCNTRGATTSATNGIITFSTASSTQGNSNNLIDNCNINAASVPGTFNNTNTYRNGIYSSGTANANNQNNTVSNCNILNFFVNGGTGNTNSPTGIHLFSNTTNWTISNNSFYITQKLSPNNNTDLNAIRIQNTGFFTITGNFIGGNSPNCNGTWDNVAVNNAYVRYRMLSIVSSSTATESLFENNTIANFNISPNGSTTQNSLFWGISQGGGRWRFNQNYFGAKSDGTGEINIAWQGNPAIPPSGGASSEALARAINVSSSTAIATITNNIIQEMNTSTTGGRDLMGIWGIDINSASTSTATTIDNNTISNITINSKINATNGSIAFLGINVAAGLVHIGQTTQNTIGNNIVINQVGTSGETTSAIGIRYSANTAGIIANNEINGITINDANNGANSLLGISISNGNLTVSNNLITNLTSNPNATSTTSNFIGGITIIGGTPTLRSNTISNLASQATTANSVVYGIYISGGTPVFGTATGQENTISGLSNTSSGLAATIIGVYNSVNNITIRYNIVENFTSANNLIIGIINASSASSPFIQNNIVRNLNQTSTAITATLIGISNSTNGGTPTISNNQVYNLDSRSTAPALTDLLAVVGIVNISQGAGTPTITNNTIYSIRSSNTSTASTNAAGILISGGVNLIVTNNRIYDITHTTTGANSGAAGIIARDNGGTSYVYNNMISLGLNPDGTANTTPMMLAGIWQNSDDGQTLQTYYNSVHIGGNAASGSYKTYGFLRGDFDGTTTIQTPVRIINNIFHNARTGSGSHFAIGNTDSPNNWSGILVDCQNTNEFVDYNALYASANNRYGEWLGNNYNFNNWQTNSDGDSHSINLNSAISFTNSATADLHVPNNETRVNAVGLFITNPVITTDYDGQTRRGPDIGADEVNNIFTSVNNTQWTNANTWDLNGVPSHADEVIIVNDVTLQNNQTGYFYGLQINNTGSLTLQGTAALYSSWADGYFINNGTFNFGATSNLYLASSFTDTGTFDGLEGTTTFNVDAIPLTNCVTSAYIEDFNNNTNTANLTSTVNTDFYNLTIVNNGIATINSNGQDISVDNVFDNQGAGQIVIGNNTLTLNGTITGTGTITGSNSSNLVVGGTSGGSLGTLNFTTGAQLLNNFTMQRSGTGAEVTLGTPVTYDNTLTLIGGLIQTTSTNILTADVSATVVGGSDASYVDGPMAKNTNSTTPFTFPVGKNNHLGQISFAPTSNAPSTFIAEYFRGNAWFLTDPVDNNWEPSLDHVSGLEYWSLTRPSGLAPATVTLHWTQFSDVADQSSEWVGLRVARLSNDGTIWENEGSGVVNGVSTAQGIVRSDIGLTEFGTFTLATTIQNPGNPLPARVVSLTAEVINNQKVMLKWLTIIETNNRSFEIERSINGIDFQLIGQKDGAGNSNQIRNYTFLDNNPPSGLVYYRLQQVDFDGNKMMTNLVKVRITDPNAQEFKLYPTPATSVLNLDMPLAQAQKVKVIFKNLQGEMVKSEVLNLSAGFSQSVLPLNDLHAGTYIVEIYTQAKVYNTKIVKY